MVGICLLIGKVEAPTVCCGNMKGVKEEDQSVDTKTIELAQLKIGLCIATCAYVDPVICAKHPFECNVKDDLQVIFEEMKQADGV